MRKRTTAALAATVLAVVLTGGVAPTSAAFATGWHHGGGHTPVTICHHGKTITVDNSAVPGHVRHGDTLGECAPVVVTPEPEPTEEPSTPPTDEPTTPPATEEPSPEPTEPEPTTPPTTEPPATIPPKPADLVTEDVWWWDDSDLRCDTHEVQIWRGVLIQGYILKDGVWIINPDPDSWRQREDQSIRPMTDEEISACDSKTPPTGEPTTPAPSDVPTTPAPGTPTPTGGTTPPASSGTATTAPTAPRSSATATAAPIAASTSDGTDRLAYTGIDGRGAIGLAVLALGLAALGGTILVLRTRARRRSDS